MQQGARQTISMRKIIVSLLCLATSLQFMAGCALQQTVQPATELASLQNQRAVNALFALAELENIDTLIRLDNRWLENRFESVLRTQATAAGVYDIRKIKFSFINQIIYMEAIVDVKDEIGNSVTANLSGDINLFYRGKGLEWRPRFSQLKIKTRDFVFAGHSYIEATPELTQTILQNLREDIAQAVGGRNQMAIAVNPVPLGEVQVGAALPELTDSTASSTQPLRGVFMVAGSAVLVDSPVTSVALDLTFIPDLSTCPADVTVSRAEFARNIRSREPVTIAQSIQQADDARYFFSEITGARQPLTIIHYWFADGLPQVVEELPVGASERWRTWSENRAVNAGVSQWEVLVVEKESGCILAAKSIRTAAAETLITRVNPVTARQSFDEFKEAFNRRTSGFSIAADKPGIALIGVRRPFLQEVLQAALAELNLDARFDSGSLPELQFSAELQAFDGNAVTCAQRDCSPAPLCKINLSQCKRLRDTRDCSSCQFRNPLNNRCVSAAIDPLCEASRERQNASYEELRNTCIAQAENAKRECDLLNVRAFDSCQIESGSNESACEGVRAGLQALPIGATLAQAEARAQTAGWLSAHFSNFLIEGDLDRLQLDLSLHSNLQLAGELNFKPVSDTLPLAKCISAWKAPFKSRFTSTPEVANLLSELDPSASVLTAHWSGFGVTIETRPSPLAAVFVDNPRLLARCDIGLTVNKVEAAMAGENAAFFRGQTELLIQALPTKIHLAPATIEFGNMVYSADAKLSAQLLRYDIRE